MLNRMPKALVVLAAGCALAGVSACASKPPAAGVETSAEQAAAPPTATPQGQGGFTSSSPSLSLQEQLAAAAGDRVYFELDSAALTAEGREVLARQAQWLAVRPAVGILIAGNCDERGTREYNLALGARRAQAVYDFLLRQGVPQSRMKTISYGKERPIDGGADESAWARNRNAQTIVS